MNVNGWPLTFFPPIPVWQPGMNETWRDRLRAAIERTGKKHSVIARDAGVAPETLSRILNAAHQQPSIETVARIAHAIGENVGWLLSEPVFALSADEQRELRKVVRFLDDAVINAAAHRRDRHEPNAAPAGNAEIPRLFATRGARLAYEAAGESMLAAGILDRDLLFVKPTRSTREAAGRVVVCRLDGAEYVKVLDIRGGRMRLLSRSDRYPPIEVMGEDFELIGVVVGRSGVIS